MSFLIQSLKRQQQSWGDDLDERWQNANVRSKQCETVKWQQAPGRGISLCKCSLSPQICLRTGDALPREAHVMSSGHRNSKREEKHARNMGGFLCYVAGSFTPSICFFLFLKISFQVSDHLCLWNFCYLKNVKILLPKIRSHWLVFFFLKAEKKQTMQLHPSVLWK